MDQSNTTEKLRGEGQGQNSGQQHNQTRHESLKAEDPVEGQPTCITSPGNPGRTLDSRVCQSCAACCKEYHFYSDNPDMALRFHWLGSKRITVQKLRDDLWVIHFDIPCDKLERKKDGTYACRHYKQLRPGFCRTYPMNFITPEMPKEMLDWESRLCKELRRLTKQ